MTISEEANPIDLDVPPALEHATLRPMLPVLELLDRPETEPTRAIHRTTAAHTTTQTVRLSRLVACYLPKRGGSVSSFYNIRSRWFLSAIITFPINGSRLMTSGLRQDTVWTLETLNVSSINSGNPPSWKISSIGRWYCELVRLA